MSALRPRPLVATWLPLLAGVLAVSTGSLLVKLCTVPALSLAAYRLGLAAPVFLVLSAWQTPGWWRALSRRQWLWAGVSGLFLGLHFATWIASLSYTTVTSSVVLVTTNPLFVGLGSVLFLKERVAPRLWLGMLLALLGSLVIAGFSPTHPETAPNPLLGNALALLGALFMSGYLLLGRQLQAELSTGVYVSAVYSFAALALLGLVGWQGSPMTGFSPRDGLLLVLMAVVPQGIGHTLLNRSLARLPASVVALAILGEPVAASAMAALVLHEIPLPGQAAGAVLVLWGVMVGSGSSPSRSSP